ncbi:serine/threonine-protein kinase Sgk2 isoform X4 [Odocoileus virginianus]|uniref:Serine/threonine-protein kinase Sgk2 isoform X4 n=1 Tax=Odocoileus virginianus TaxID=9874 RepID=A0ABM4ILR1_ODOVR
MDSSPAGTPSPQLPRANGNINLGPSANPNARPTDFDFLKVIGKGNYGKVLLAKHKSDGMFYAVKVLQKKSILKKKEQSHIMAERSVLLKNVRHPFLVGLRYSFQTPEKLYFVLDYVNGGELFFHLQRERRFLEPRARFYAAEVASAIGYLHSLNIIYRDLKPENILLDCQGHVVLTDFGLCKEGVEPEETTSTFCGTPEVTRAKMGHTDLHFILSLPTALTWLRKCSVRSLTIGQWIGGAWERCSTRCYTACRPSTAKTCHRCMRTFCTSHYGFPGAGRWPPATSCKPCSTKTRGSGWAPKQTFLR